MSEYVTVDVKFYDGDCLIEALKAIYPEVEVHEQAKDLIGYDSRGRGKKAHIIVRKKHISSVSNDLGFELIGNEYHVHISDYDIKKGKTIIPRIKQEYAVAKTIKTARQRGWSVRRENVEGKVKLTVKGIR